MNNNTNKNSTFQNPIINQKIIQNYLINFNHPIGQGNFSKVFKATHLPTNKQVAIKIIQLSSLTNPRVQQLLNTETTILKMISHPNIIGCEEILTSSRNCYIITQLCKGGDLEKRLRDIGLVRQRQLYQIAVDVYEGMKYLASKKIVHRDIKIANIFINNGVYKIADFGFAQIKERQFQDVIVGSPIYMSPQSYIQNIYSQKTDIWAFGILLYQLVQGRTPCYNCQNEKELKANLLKQINKQSFKSYISQELKNLIIKCLNIQPNLRIELSNIQKTQWMQKAYQFLKHNQNKNYHEIPSTSHHQSVQLSNQIITNIKSRKPSISLGSQNSLITTNFRCIGQQLNQKSKTNLNEHNLVQEDLTLKTDKPQNFIYLKKFDGENSSTSSESKNSEPSESKLDSNSKFSSQITKSVPIKKYNQFESLKFKNGIKMLNQNTKQNEKKKDFSKTKTIQQQNLKNNILNQPKNINFTKNTINNDSKINNNTINSFIIKSNEYQPTRQTHTNTNLFNQNETSFIIKNIPLTQNQQKIILTPSNIKIICKPLKFSDCISLIHYCRLCYKFSSLPKQHYDNEQSKIFLAKWSVQILTQILQILNQNENQLIFENDSTNINKLKQITKDYLIKYQTTYKSIITQPVTINQASMYIYNLYMKQGFQYTQKIKNKNSTIYDALMTFLSLLDKQTRNLMQYVYKIKNTFNGKNIEYFLNVKFTQLNEQRTKQIKRKNKENIIKHYQIV